MMKAKMKKAPYFNEQEKHEQANAFSDWLVLVGKGATGAYYRNKEAGKGTHWQMIRERYKLPLDYCPVILDSKTFAEIDRLQIAPGEQRHILFFGVGEIPTMSKSGDDLKTRLLLNLAKHCPNVTTVEWIDEALQRENLFPLLEKIKQGEDTVAEVLKAKENTANNPDNHGIDEAYEDFFNRLGDNGKVEEFLKWYNIPDGTIKAESFTDTRARNGKR